MESEVNLHLIVKISMFKLTLVELSLKSYIIDTFSCKMNRIEFKSREYVYYLLEYTATRSRK